MWGKANSVKPYDSQNMRPAIRCSICTGEKMAGFQDVKSGRFEEVMLIENAGDLERFRKRYGIQGELYRIY